MAFFANVGPDPYRQQAGMLGQALGQGLGAYQQRQQQQEQQGILSRALLGQISPEEMQKLSPDVQIQLSGLMQKQAAEKRKSQLMQQLFPDEFGMKKQEVNQEGEKSSIQTELQPAMQPKKRPEVSDAAIAAIAQDDPALAKLLQSQKESRRKEQIKAEEISRKEQIEFHKESAKYDEDISKKSEAAEKKLKAIEQQEKILPQITKKDRLLTALFSGTKYENLVKSKNAQEFDSLVLPMLEGMRTLFGTRLSDADLRLVLQKIATSEKDPGANKAILNWQKLEAKLDIEKKKIGDEIRKENRGLRPLDYQQQITERMDKKFGSEIDAAAQNILQLEEDPQDYALITQRTKVPKGTSLDTKAIDLYLKIAENDAEKAAQMAREDGYVF